MHGGFVGRLLRVDSTAGTTPTAWMPDEAVLRRYVGGVGPAVWLVAAEAPPSREAAASLGLERIFRD